MPKKLVPLPELEQARIKKKLKNAKLELATTARVEELDYYVTVVLAALSMYQALVTDLSKVSDFGLDKNQLEIASSVLALRISEKEYIFEVAQRLKDRVVV